MYSTASAPAARAWLIHKQVLQLLVAAVQQHVRLLAAGVTCLL
jgi:hypothetical protein